MSFRFAARTLLELGKELISSDEVAIYELIKNGVDAGSPTITVDVRVVVPHSAMKSALDAASKGVDRTNLLSALRADIDVSASRKEIGDYFASIDEAVERGCTIRSALLEAYERYNWIEIADEGHGMSLSELDEIFLTVGTRSRRESNVAGAEYLGDKGVGRLSAMRLGDLLQVETSRSGEESFNELEIDWSVFSHDSTLDVSEIDVKPRRGRRKQNRSLHGTRIRISRLSADWSEARLQEMLIGKVARMVDPFEKGKANRLLSVRYNGNLQLIPSIPEKLLQAAHASCRARFYFNEQQEPELSGTMTYRLRNASRSVNQQGAELLSVAQRVFRRRGKAGHASTTATPLRLTALRELGPFDVEVYWYNRLIVEAIEGLTQNVAKSRAEIARWAGGPMLFRRGFRILPYGDPGDDWLELDKSAFGQPGFKLNRQQLIGRVRVTASHAALSEQTNREGLVQSDARDALRIILMWLLHNEFRSLINEADAAHELRQRKERLERVDLGGATHAIDSAFAKLEEATPSEAGPHLAHLRGLIEQLSAMCRTVIQQSEADAARAESEREKFVYLAGIGLMTESIFHELDRAVQHTLRIISAAKGQHSGLSALEEQLFTLHKRVSAFDELTGERRQTKTAFDVRDVVTLVLDNHANEFQRHGVKATFDASQPLKIRAVKGMLLQILENLVANALYWLKVQKKIEIGFQPVLEFTLDARGKSLSVSDNGPGVDPSRKEVIFQPFVTSKPPGLGRGLGLYISRELAEYHGWRLDVDGTSSYRPGRLNTFVLDLGTGNE